MSIDLHNHGSRKAMIEFGPVSHDFAQHRQIGRVRPVGEFPFFLESTVGNRPLDLLLQRGKVPPIS